MSRPTVAEVAQRTLAEPKITSYDGGTPYCLHAAEDYFKGDLSKVGHFLLVNRAYGPLSTTIPGDHPSVVALRKLPSFYKHERSHFLYLDDCCPERNAKSLKAYVARLKALCKA